MQQHKVIFNPPGVIVEARAELYPYGTHGKPGSLLDIALTHGVSIEHACGGAGVCGTCIVEVKQGMENLSEAGDDEIG